MQKAVMQLETLTCPTCIKKIESALLKVTGVDGVKVLFNASKAKIAYDDQQVTAIQLKETVEQLGYEVLTVKTN